MREPLHWPPGAPVLFAVGLQVLRHRAGRQTYDIRSAYWEQAIITTGTTALAILLAWIVAGPWAGLLAGALVGTYPPLIGATGDQLSEPLGAFLLLAAFVALALALKREGRRWYVARGRAVRAHDPHPHRPAAGAVPDRRPRRPDRADPDALVALADPAAALLAGAAVVLAPWTIYASPRRAASSP